MTALETLLIGGIWFGACFLAGYILHKKYGCKDFLPHGRGRGPWPFLIICLLLSSCTFQVMPDKSSVRAQQRMADALEHYLENHDTRTLSSPGFPQAKVPDAFVYRFYPKGALLGIKYLRGPLVVEGEATRLVWLEFRLENGGWQIRAHFKAPKDTLNNTLYED